MAYINPILDKNGLATDKTELTIVHGVDLNPNGKFGPLSGFDPNNIEVEIKSKEVVTSGASGKDYTALQSSVMALGDFRRKFPTYDIDAHYYGANDTSLVVVSTFTVPSADFQVPNTNNLIDAKECAVFDPKTSKLKLNYLTFDNSGDSYWAEMCVAGTCTAQPIFGISNFGVNPK